MFPRLIKIKSRSAVVGVPVSGVFSAGRTALSPTDRVAHHYDQIQREIDNQAARLEAFMGLALFQIEAIQVKYPPVSFVCHLPFATPLVSWWNDACTPVLTTPYLREKPPDKEPSKPASNLVSAVAPP
jgi:hypothetical protein